MSDDAFFHGADFIYDCPDDCIWHPEDKPVAVVVLPVPHGKYRGRYTAWLDGFRLTMNTTHPGHYAAHALLILGHRGWFHLFRADGSEMFKPKQIVVASWHFANPTNGSFDKLDREQYAEHRARVQKFLDNPDATSTDDEEDGQ